MTGAEAGTSGGTFGSVGGQSIVNLAHIFTNGAVDGAWRPNPDGAVYAMAKSGDVLYCGGAFFTLAGNPRQFLGAVNATNGVALPWNPAPSQYIYSIAVADVIYVGGAFQTGGLAVNTIGGKPREYVAALNPVSGIATEWNPQPNGPVEDIQVMGDTVLLAGLFTLVKGQVQRYFAGVDRSGGSLVTNSIPSADAPVYELLVRNQIVYLGGSFGSIGGIMRRGLAAFDMNTGLARLSQIAGGFDFFSGATGAIAGNLR